MASKNTNEDEFNTILERDTNLWKSSASTSWPPACSVNSALNDNIGKVLAVVQAAIETGEPGAKLSQEERQKALLSAMWMLRPLVMIYHPEKASELDQYNFEDLRVAKGLIRGLKEEIVKNVKDIWSKDETSLFSIEVFKAFLSNIHIEQAQRLLSKADQGNFDAVAATTKSLEDWVNFGFEKLQLKKTGEKKALNAFLGEVQLANEFFLENFGKVKK